MRDDGYELTLHPVQLAELVHGVVLRLEQLLEALRLLREDLVLFGESVGERAAPEVHLSREDQGPQEDDDGPEPLVQVEASDHGAEQPKADVREEELVRARHRASV